MSSIFLSCDQISFRFSSARSSRSFAHRRAIAILVSWPIGLVSSMLSSADMVSLKVKDQGGSAVPWAKKAAPRSGSIVDVGSGVIPQQVQICLLPLPQAQHGHFRKFSTPPGTRQSPQIALLPLLHWLLAPWQWCLFGNEYHSGQHNYTTKLYSS